jgi:hypothetical protein
MALIGNRKESLVIIIKGLENGRIALMVHGSLKNE